MYQYIVPFGEAVKRAFSNYCVFTGRASRSEYWWWVLFINIVAWVISVPSAGMSMDAIDALARGNYQAAFQFGYFNVFNYIGSIWSVAIILPSFGLLFRRLHDAGHSGWNWLWIFFPLVGWIVLLVFLCQDSEPVNNQYGPVPNIRN